MATRIRAFPNSPNSIKKAKDAHFRALVGRAHIENKIKKQDMAKAACMTVQSLRNKLDRPETITLGELRRMYDFLGWSLEDLSKII